MARNDEGKPVEDEVIVTGTKRPKSSRAYFIAVEDTLLRYGEEIEQGLQQRVVNLERNQKTGFARNAQGSAPGVVYVLRAPIGSITAHKLGMSSNFGKRMQSHHSALADNLDVVYVYKTEHMKQIEACAKGILQSVKYRNQTDLDSIKKIIAGCEDICSEVKGLPAKRHVAHGGASDADHFIVLHNTTD